MPGAALLVLDQSLSSTGYALLDESDVASGSWRLCDGAAKRAQGFRALWQHMDNIHKARGLGKIVHESPAFGAANRGEAQLIGAIGLIAVVELFAESRGIGVESYPVQSWRGTFFTKAERKAIRAMPNKLRDWKRPAIERCRQFGFDPLTGDEAEALAILDHHLHCHEITPAWRLATPLLEPVA